MTARDGKRPHDQITPASSKKPSKRRRAAEKETATLPPLRPTHGLRDTIAFLRDRQDSARDNMWWIDADSHTSSDSDTQDKDYDADAPDDARPNVARPGQRPRSLVGK